MLFSSAYVLIIVFLVSEVVLCAYTAKAPGKSRGPLRTVYYVLSITHYALNPQMLCSVRMMKSSCVFLSSVTK